MSNHPNINAFIAELVGLVERIDTLKYEGRHLLDELFREVDFNSNFTKETEEFCSHSSIVNSCELYKSAKKLSNYFGLKKEFEELLDPEAKKWYQKNHRKYQEKRF